MILKHHRKRWVRRQRYKQPSLIAMHRIVAEFFGRQEPLIFERGIGVLQYDD